MLSMGNGILGRGRYDRTRGRAACGSREDQIPHLIDIPPDQRPGPGGVRAGELARLRHLRVEARSADLVAAPLDRHEASGHVRGRPVLLKGPVLVSMSPGDR